MSGPKNAYSIVHDFQDEWEVYDADLKMFTPYVSENQYNSVAHTVEIDTDDFLGTNILVSSKVAGNYLFINGAMVRSINKDQWLVFKLNELRAKYKTTKLQFTIFGNSNVSDKVIQVGHLNTVSVKEKNIEKASFYNLVPRNMNPYKSTFSLVVLLLVTYLTYLTVSFSRATLRFYNIRELFTFLIREQSFLINKPLNRMNILFVVFLSMITAFLYSILQSKGISILGNGRFILQEGDTFGVLITNYIKLTLLFFILFILKFFLLSTIGRLFNLDKVVDIHYFKILQFTIIIFSISVLVLFVLFNSYLVFDSRLSSFIFAGLAIFYSLRTINIYFTINRSINVQSLYLISYLCVVEIVPIVIGLRFAL